MSARLEDKVAIVTGAGQTPGETIGNGRATALLFAREGARVMLVDMNLESARETERMIADEGGTSFAFAADVTREDDCRALAEECVRAWGRSISSTTTWVSAPGTRARFTSRKRRGIASWT